MEKRKKYSSLFEGGLWLASVTAILLSFFLTDSKGYLYLAASLIGATALIFVAKANVIGQMLTVVFAVFYGVISYEFHYYGEMITYLGMSAPIAAAAVISWLRNPYKGNRAEVTVNSLSAKEYALLAVLSIAVTVAFYFILRALNTANLIISTVSVLTSFAASYLTLRRSHFYALAYAANDVVLISLWALAMRSNAEYLAMVICFTVFLLNDLYGLIYWARLRVKQAENA